jgi:hypothetical protein
MNDTYEGPSAEVLDGFHLYPVKDGWVIADGGGWIPGSWPTRDEALAGGHAYAREFGYAPFDADDDDTSDEDPE